MVKKESRKKFINNTYQTSNESQGGRKHRTDAQRKLTNGRTSSQAENVNYNNEVMRYTDNDGSQGGKRSNGG